MVWLAAATARAVTVDGDPTVYVTIQEAIDAAPVGGTVRVGAGTYAESLSVVADLAIVGDGSALVTVAAPAGNGLTITGAAVTVMGISVEAPGGHGVRATTDADVEAFDVAVRSALLDGVSLNRATLSATGLVVTGASLHALAAGGVPRTVELEACDLTGGTFADEGLVVHSSGYGLTAIGCTFREALAVDNAGIYVTDANAEVRDSTFSNLTSSLDGTAIYVDGGSLVLEDSVLTDCLATDDTLGDGAVVVVQGGDLTVSGTSFVRSGGVALLDGGVATISDSSLDVIQSVDGVTVRRSSAAVVTDTLAAGASWAVLAEDVGELRTERVVSCPGSGQVTGLASLVRVGLWTSTNDVGIGLNTVEAQGLLSRSEAVFVADGVADLRQVTLVGYDVSTSFVSVLGADVTLADSVLAYGDGPGPVVTFDAGATVTVDNVVAWSVAGGPGLDGLLDVDPVLIGAPFASVEDRCSAAWWPTAWSWARDGGDVAVLDPDGTIAAIGASGGPDAPAFLYEDGDDDGAVLACDCDDTRADLSPFAVELCNALDDDCDGVVDGPGSADAPTWCADLDGDLFGGGPGLTDCEGPLDWLADCADCNDEDGAIHPGSPEDCAVEDRDCDGDPESGAVDAPSWYADADGDGFGDALASTVSCAQPPDHVADATDCQDADSDAFPGADEWCGGGDEDCDTVVDEPDAVDAPTWYLDDDGDGYGTDATSVVACVAPANFVALAGDCDDADETLHPATEWFADVDGDGFGAGEAVLSCEAPALSAAVAGDCDDGDDAVSPAGVERCADGDEDCDGLSGDDDPDVVDPTDWYADGDGDSWGDAFLATACLPPPQAVATPGDCDDADPFASPDASEACGGGDEDCDGLVDDADSDVADAVVWFEDGDHDGFGSLSLGALCVPPEGAVALGGDCEDADPALHPLTPWYADADGDGYGVGDPVEGCIAPAEHAGLPGDCDDFNAAVSPAADESCAPGDEDCDGLTEDADAGVVDVRSWYADGDGDGFGLGLVAVACVGPDGSVAEDGDCNDADAAISPDAVETCEAGDEDCDGLVDDEDAPADPVVWYEDLDGDGFGGAPLFAACLGPPEAVAVGGDCADTDSELHPLTAWFLDLDGDGFGAGDPVLSCAAPDQSVRLDGDCDDADDAISPNAEERCAAGDEDCDGSEGDDDADVSDPTAWFVDGDGDGFGAADAGVACEAPEGATGAAGDCDDDNPSVSPAGLEVCGGSDEDCDGLLDDEDPDTDLGAEVDFYADVDGDGHGDPAVVARACGTPDGFVASPDDCNDADGLAWTGAVEVCDGSDNDCDGSTDGPDSVDAPSWFADADGDGFGDPADSVPSCAPVAERVDNGMDCDDGEPLAWEGAVEACDGVDNDCDAVVDPPESLGALTFLVDQDGDGFGVDGAVVYGCVLPDGASSAGGDCDDARDDVHPDADERCGGVDEDCDDVLDESDAVDAALWYADADSDGRGDPGTPVPSCTPLDGFVAAPDDCNDAEPLAWEGAEEICDGVDNDCDGSIDVNAVDGTEAFVDGDGDGFGDDDSRTTSCGGATGVAVGGDCDDKDGAVFPGADEVPGNGVDEDCDGRDLPIEDSGDTDEPDPEGCRCASGGPSPRWGVAVLALWIARRRR